MKTYIGKLGSLGKCNDIEKLENRPDFYKMINLNAIEGLHDYVNRTALNAQEPTCHCLTRLRHLADVFAFSPSES